MISYKTVEEREGIIKALSTKNIKKWVRHNVEPSSFK